jgi:hypothetical protein
MDTNRNRRVTPLRCKNHNVCNNFLVSQQPRSPKSHLEEMIASRIRERPANDYGRISESLEKNISSSSKYDELTNKLKEIPLFNKQNSSDHQQKFNQAYDIPQDYGYNSP